MKNSELISKSLSSIFILAILALSFTQGKLIANDRQNPYNMSDNDAQVQVMPDGTKNIQAADGSFIQLKSDGTKTIKKPDGTFIQVNPDGSKIIRKSDGTTINVKPGE